MIYKHTERLELDSIRSGKVETTLKWKWNVWYQSHHAAACFKTQRDVWKMRPHVWVINSNDLTSHDKRLEMKFQSQYFCIPLSDADVTCYGIKPPEIKR